MNDSHPKRDALCGNCGYYREQDQGAGACHRYPPTFAGAESPRELHHWRFPLVLSGWWCGEHRPATVAEAPTGGNQAGT
jgi:hypothetical protein